MPARKHTPERKSRSGPSGPTQSKDARRANGKVRFEVWLPRELAESIEDLASDGEMNCPKADVVAAAVLVFENALQMAAERSELGPDLDRVLDGYEKYVRRAGRRI
jgi:hypothetical protein